MYAPVNGALPSYDGQRMSSSSSGIISGGPLSTGYDWKRKLAEHRAATEANLFELNKKQMIPASNPLRNSGAMSSHDLDMQGAVPGPLDLGAYSLPSQDQGLGHAKRELNALLNAVQSSLADLRGEVAAASHLSSHASAAMHELQAAPFHASLPPRPLSRYPGTPAAGRGPHTQLHPPSSSGMALPRGRHGSTSILSSPAAHPELTQRAGHGMVHDVHALGAPQPADVWNAPEGGEQAGYAFPTDMQASFNRAREGANLSKVVQSKIDELGQRLEQHMQLQQAQLMRPVQAEAHNHSEALILLGVSKSEAAEKAAMELKIGMSSWERQYGKDMEAAQQRVSALASSTQAHWERLCEVAASVDELQQKPPPQIPDVAPLELGLGQLREQVQALASRVPKEVQEAAAAGEARLKQALQQQDQMRNSLAASMLERAEARSKQQSAETQALLEELDSKMGQQVQERAQQQESSFTMQLQQLEAKLTQQAQAAAKEVASKLQQLEAKLSQQAQAAAKDSASKLQQLEAKLDQQAQAAAKDSATQLQQLEVKLGQQAEKAQEQTKQQSTAAFEERLQQLEAKLMQQVQEQAKQQATDYATQLQQLEAKLSQQAQAAAKDSAARLQQLEQGIRQAQEATQQSTSKVQQLEPQMQQASASAQDAQQQAADAQAQAQAQAQALPAQLATHKEQLAKELATHKEKHAKELAAQVSQVSQKVEAQRAELSKKLSQLEEGLKQQQAAAAAAAAQKGQQQQQQQQPQQEPSSKQADTTVTAIAAGLEPRLLQLEQRLAELKEGRAEDKAAVAGQAKQHEALNERVCATEEAILELDQALQQQGKQQQGDTQVARKAAERAGVLESFLKELEAGLKKQQAKMEQALREMEEHEKQSSERLSHLEATQEQQVASGLSAVEGAVHGLEDERKERNALGARLTEAERALQALRDAWVEPETQAKQQEQQQAHVQQQQQQPMEQQLELMQQKLRELQHLVGGLNAQEQVLESVVHGQLQELQEAGAAVRQQAAQQQSELRALQVQQQGQAQEQAGLVSEVHMMRSSTEEVGGLVQQLEQQVQNLQQQQQQQQHKDTFTAAGAPADEPTQKQLQHLSEALSAVQGRLEELQQLEQQVQAMQQQQQQQEPPVQQADLQALQQQLHALEGQQQEQEQGVRAELEQQLQRLQALETQVEKQSSTVGGPTAGHAASSMPDSSEHSEQQQQQQQQQQQEQVEELRAVALQLQGSLQDQAKQLQQHTAELQQQREHMHELDEHLHEHDSLLQGLREAQAAAESRHASLVMQLHGVEHSIEGAADAGASTQTQLEDQEEDMPRTYALQQQQQQQQAKQESRPRRTASDSLEANHPSPLSRSPSAKQEQPPSIPAGLAHAASAAEDHPPSPPHAQSLQQHEAPAVHSAKSSPKAEGQAGSKSASPEPFPAGHAAEEQPQASPSAQPSPSGSQHEGVEGTAAAAATTAAADEEAPAEASGDDSLSIPGNDDAGGDVGHGAAAVSPHSGAASLSDSFDGGDDHVQYDTAAATATPGPSTNPFGDAEAAVHSNPFGGEEDVHERVHLEGEGAGGNPFAPMGEHFGRSPGINMAYDNAMFEAEEDIERGEAHSEGGDEGEGAARTPLKQASQASRPFQDDVDDADRKQEKESVHRPSQDVDDDGEEHKEAVRKSSKQEGSDNSSEGGNGDQEGSVDSGSDAYSEDADQQPADNAAENAEDQQEVMKDDVQQQAVAVGAHQHHDHAGSPIEVDGEEDREAQEQGSVEREEAKEHVAEEREGVHKKQGEGGGGGDGGGAELTEGSREVEAVGGDEGEAQRGVADAAGVDAESAQAEGRGGAPKAKEPLVVGTMTGDIDESSDTSSVRSDGSGNEDGSAGQGGGHEGGEGGMNSSSSVAGRAEQGEVSRGGQPVGVGQGGGEAQVLQLMGSSEDEAELEVFRPPDRTGSASARFKRPSPRTSSSEVGMGKVEESPKGSGVGAWALAGLPQGDPSAPEAGASGAEGSRQAEVAREKEGLSPRAEASRLKRELGFDSGGSSDADAAGNSAGGSDGGGERGGGSDDGHAAAAGEDNGSLDLLDSMQLPGLDTPAPALTPAPATARQAGSGGDDGGGVAEQQQQQQQQQQASSMRGGRAGWGDESFSVDMDEDDGQEQQQQQQGGEGEDEVVATASQAARQHAPPQQQQQQQQQQELLQSATHGLISLDDEEDVLDVDTQIGGTLPPNSQPQAQQQQQQQQQHPLQPQQPPQTQQRGGRGGFSLSLDDLDDEDDVLDVDAHQIGGTLPPYSQPQAQQQQQQQDTPSDRSSIDSGMGWPGMHHGRAADESLALDDGSERLTESGLSLDLPSPPGMHARQDQHQNHQDPRDPSSSGAPRGVAESLSVAGDSLLSTSSLTELGAEHLPPPPVAEDARRHGSSAQSSGVNQQHHHQRLAGAGEGAFPPCSYSIRVFTADTPSASLNSDHMVHIELLGSTQVAQQALPRGSSHFQRKGRDAFQLSSSAGPLGLLLGVRLWHEPASGPASGSLSIKNFFGGLTGPVKWCVEKVEVQEQGGCNAPGRCHIFVPGNHRRGVWVAAGQHGAVLLRPATTLPEDIQQLAHLKEEWRQQLQSEHQALGRLQRAQLLSGMERVADFLTARVMPAGHARRPSSDFGSRSHASIHPARQAAGSRASTDLSSYGGSSPEHHSPPDLHDAPPSPASNSNSFSRSKSFGSPSRIPRVNVSAMANASLSSSITSHSCIPTPSLSVERSARSANSIVADEAVRGRRRSTSTPGNG